MTFRSFLETFSSFWGVKLYRFYVPPAYTDGRPHGHHWWDFFVFVGLYLRSNPQEGSKFPWTSLGRLLGRQEKASQDREARSTGNGGTKGETGGSAFIGPSTAAGVGKKGRLTIAQTAIALNVPLDQVEGPWTNARKKEAPIWK